MYRRCQVWVKMRRPPAAARNPPILLIELPGYTYKKKSIKGS